MVPLSVIEHYDSSPLPPLNTAFPTDVKAELPTQLCRMKASHGRCPWTPYAFHYTQYTWQKTKGDNLRKLEA